MVLAVSDIEKTKVIVSEMIKDVVKKKPLLKHATIADVSFDSYE